MQEAEARHRAAEAAIEHTRLTASGAVEEASSVVTAARAELKMARAGVRAAAEFNAFKGAETEPLIHNDLGDIEQAIPWGVTCCRVATNYTYEYVYDNSSQPTLSVG